MTSEATPFTDQAVAAIIAHMNDDHAADTLVICRALAGLPEATSARLTGLDHDGITLAATVAGDEQVAHVRWFEAPTDRAGIRHEIVRLFDAASAVDEPTTGTATA